MQRNHYPEPEEPARAKILGKRLWGVETTATGQYAEKRTRFTAGTFPGSGSFDRILCVTPGGRAFPGSTSAASPRHSTSRAYCSRSAFTDRCLDFLGFAMGGTNGRQVGGGEAKRRLSPIHQQYTLRRSSRVVLRINHSSNSRTAAA